MILLTVARLREVLRYEPDTGLWYWIAKTAPRANSITIGSVAGSVRADGYLQIKIDGIRYMAQRLAFLYMLERWPTRPEVDHIDLVRAHNRWANLREATYSENKWNTVAQINNTSGYKGVVRCRARWRAQIAAHGKMHHLGVFDHREAAHEAYIVAARELHGEFARAA